LAKTLHFGKITRFTAFDENRGFRDFRVSVMMMMMMIRYFNADCPVSRWRTFRRSSTSVNRTVFLRPVCSRRSTFMMAVTCHKSSAVFNNSAARSDILISRFN